MASLGIRPIEVFIAVAESGSLSQAARTLGVSQPAVSEALASIERNFGARLLRRDPSGVELTSEGRALYGPAQQVLRSYGQLLGALDAHARLEGGLLSLSCPPMLALDPLAPLVGRFRASHPKTRVRVHRPSEPSGATDHLRSGEAEIALMSQRDDNTTGLVFDRLVRQSYVGIVPPECKLPPSGPPQALLDVGLVSPTHRGTARRLMEEAVGADRYAESVVVESPHLGSLVPLVLNGLGAAVVSEALASEACAAGIKTYAITPKLESEVFLVYRSDWRTRTADDFLALSREMSSSGALRNLRGQR